MSHSSTIARRPRLDRLCAEAVELARAAAEETGEGVGEHLTTEAEADRVATHYFACELPGYRGWRWAVVVARAPRARNVTVSETALLPGGDALTAPVWVPWADRLRAGDVGVGDLLPTDESDERLEPAYQLSDDDAVEDVAFELGVGRARVMSREGRIDTAERWYEGDHGPNAEIATSAPDDARCGTCGFYLPLAGSMRQMFGACGNLYASDDGRVVSADHGCGAHSEVLSETAPEEPVDHLDTVYDDNLVERVSTEEEPEPAEETGQAPAELVAIDAADADADEAVTEAETAAEAVTPVETAVEETVVEVAPDGAVEDGAVEHDATEDDADVVAPTSEEAKSPVADPVEPVEVTEPSAESD
nr:DUF3027 domain-containing protein [Stackebrandtia endophytica]